MNVRLGDRLLWEEALLRDGEAAHLHVRIGWEVSRSIDRSTGAACISHAVIARRIGCSASAVEKAVRWLRKKYLHVAPRPIGARETGSPFGSRAFGGKGGANTYRLNLNVIDRTMVRSMEEERPDDGAVNGMPLTGRSSAERPDGGAGISLKRIPSGGSRRKSGATPPVETVVVAASDPLLPMLQKRHLEIVGHAAKPERGGGFRFPAVIWARVSREPAVSQ